MACVEKKIRMKVEMSEDEQTGIDIYRIWDIDCQIPKPKDVFKVEIRVNTSWEKMYFNKGWGSSHDPMGEGCWLKQKKSKYFKAQTGYHEYMVRFYTKKNNLSHMQPESINNKVEGIKQLQDRVTQLEQENLKLKYKLSKIQDVLNL